MISHPLVVVTATVLLSIVSAVLLKETSGHPDISWLVIGLVLLAVMIVNGLKFILWGVAHSRHPISSTYPLTSLFFPLILLVSHFYYGEPATLNKLVGVLLIVGGVVTITYNDDSDSGSV